jgi:hypothetical protein
MRVVPLDWERTITLDQVIQADDKHQAAEYHGHLGTGSIRALTLNTLGKKGIEQDPSAPQDTDRAENTISHTGLYQCRELGYLS